MMPDNKSSRKTASDLNDHISDFSKEKVKKPVSYSKNNDLLYVFWAIGVGAVLYFTLGSSIKDFVDNKFKDFNDMKSDITTIKGALDLNNTNPTPATTRINVSDLKVKQSCTLVHGHREARTGRIAAGELELLFTMNNRLHDDLYRISCNLADASCKGAFVNLTKMFTDGIDLWEFSNNPSLYAGPGNNDIVYISWGISSTFIVDLKTGIIEYWGTRSIFQNDPIIVQQDNQLQKLSKTNIKGFTINPKQPLKYGSASCAVSGL